jgi:hypothetical protein
MRQDMPITNTLENQKTPTPTVGETTATPLHEATPQPTQPTRPDPLVFPAGGLGVAPVRLLAAGEGKTQGDTVPNRLLILRLLARRANTGEPARLDLALSTADSLMLARAALRFLRQDPLFASLPKTSGAADPSRSAIENANAPPQSIST